MKMPSSAPLWGLALVILGGSALAFFGDFLRAGICDFQAAPPESPLQCLRQWLVTFTSVAVAIVALAAALLTVRAIGRQIKASSEDAGAQIRESHRQFSHQMRVATADKRAQVDRAARPAQIRLERLQRHVGKAIRVMNEGRLPVEQQLNVIIHDLVTIQDHLQSEAFEPVRSLLDAEAEQHIELMISQATGLAARNKAGELTANIFAALDTLEEVQFDAQQALSAVVDIRQEVRDWGRP